MTRLSRHCESVGLTGTDAATAISAYVRQGELTPDEIDVLEWCSPEVRYTYFANLFGADAARVASTDFTERAS